MALSLSEKALKSEVDVQDSARIGGIRHPGFGGTAPHLV